MPLLKSRKPTNPSGLTPIRSGPLSCDPKKSRTKVKSKNSHTGIALGEKRWPFRASRNEHLTSVSSPSEEAPAHTTSQPVSRYSRELTRTPSLSSSTSTTSTDSNPVEPCPTNISRPKEIILFRSLSSKPCLLSKELKHGNPTRAESKPPPHVAIETRCAILPMIILTPSDDEDDYCTLSPFTFNLFCPYTPDSIAQTRHLRVPITPSFKLGETPLKRRQYPHPAGPWLRPPNISGLRVSSPKNPLSKRTNQSQFIMKWKDGCRSAEGTVVGWEERISKILKLYGSQRMLKKPISDPHKIDSNQKVVIHPAVLMFPPPRLPSEQEIQQRQLQFTIDRSLRLGQQVNRKRVHRPMSTYPESFQSDGSLT